MLRAALRWIAAICCGIIDIVQAAAAGEEWRSPRTAEEQRQEVQSEVALQLELSGLLILRLSSAFSEMTLWPRRQERC